ncbi:MAG: cell wall hydrolase, partial [Hansschlegelia sp.]
MIGRFIALAGATAAIALTAAGCAQQPSPVALKTTISYSATDQECLARAMYFESNRNAEEGMRAVGTVVMNRVKSGRYAATVCEVVGQKGQFAAGALTKPMEGEPAERARRIAGEVLSGKVHRGVGDARYFHVAGMRFHYPNMHYVLVAGGNAFYEKREVATAADARENARSKALAIAYARIDPTGAAKQIAVASLEPQTTGAVIQPTVSVSTSVAHA